MKRLIVIFVALMACVGVSAQDTADAFDGIMAKYEGVKGYTAMTIPGYVMRLSKDVPKTLAKKVKKMKMMAHEQPTAEYEEDVRKAMSELNVVCDITKDEQTVVMSIDDKGTKLAILTLDKKDNMLIVMYGKDLSAEAMIQDIAESEGAQEEAE